MSGTWTTEHYKRWLQRDAQRVIRTAKFLLDTLPADDFDAIEARRALARTEYAPCSHASRGRYAHTATQPEGPVMVQQSAPRHPETATG